MEQINLFEKVDEKEVRRIVAKELKKYKALRIAIQNKRELEEQGIPGIFPTLSKDDKQKMLKFTQMDRAIANALDETERYIIEKKYLGTTRVNDINIYMEMGFTKDQYYPVKKQAIFQIARALGII